MIYRDQLEAVYRLIENEGNWMREGYNNAPRNSDGEVIDKPSCFCMAGAYLYTLDCVDYDFSRSKHLDEFADALGFTYGDTPSLFDFNDTHTHAEVLALLKAAIDRAPVRESAS